MKRCRWLLTILYSGAVLATLSPASLRAGEEDLTPLNLFLDQAHGDSYSTGDQPAQAARPTGGASAKKSALPDEATYVPPEAGKLDLMELNPDIKQPYVIVKGDTLWDIAGKFLKNPWRWMKIWERNRYIINPDLIFPGNKIWFDKNSGQLMVGARNDPGSSGMAVKTDESSGFGGPKVDGEQVGTTRVGGDGVPEKVVPLIYRYPSVRDRPVERLEAALDPRVLETALQRQDFVSLQANVRHAEGYLVGMQNTRKYFGRDDKLYVNLQRSDVRDGEQFDVFRVGDEIFDANWLKSSLGYLIVHLGRVKVLGHLKENIYEVIVVSSFEDLAPGDQLRVARNPKTIITPTAPANKLDGKVLYIRNNLGEAGQGQVIVINLGSLSGLEQGSLLEVYATGQTLKEPVDGGEVTLPDERTGKLLVLSAQDRAATAIIVESLRPINVGDMVRSGPGEP